MATERVAPGNDSKGAAALVIAAAQKEIGVKESMENSGKRVDEYNAYVGLKKVAWCASFMSWCHGQAGYPQPRTAWSPALFPPERLAKKAMRGMVMGIYYPEKGRIAHCGLVEDMKSDWCYSIEGNTNVNGGREGDGVYRKIRHIRTIAKLANWLD
ncbi:MAG: peptidoglycan-binding protein [Pedobacter sp.]|nr:MAG: peptidoglycan-binding protein [Pedobacter sp.]